MLCKDIAIPRKLGWLWTAVLLAAGCSHESANHNPICCDPFLTDGAVTIPGDRQWVETAVNVTAGEAISIVAHGAVHYRCADDNAKYSASTANPCGTFLYTDDVAYRDFPLSSAAAGPAPCYCLIGRIGNNPPFYIGKQKSWEAQHSGSLQLGINDFHVGDNSGQFYANITKPQSVQPVAFQQSVPSAAVNAPAPNQSNASVMIFYVDGLRPDVVREMAAMGHIPNINCLFIEGGTWLSNTFTAFPSDTITSNGTMWTGCFSDKHGLKGQVRFSRRTLHSQSYLEPLGPNRSSRLLAPQGIDKIIHNTKSAAIGLAQGKHKQQRFEQTDATGVPPLYQRLQSIGGNWATGALPMMTEIPPLLWTRSLIRQVPYMKSHEAWMHMDDANTHFAMQELIGRKEPVTVVWLPETDSISHKESRGQFGATRRTIVKADQMIGQLTEELRALGTLQSTYLMLVSDHGHHGGKDSHLANFDLIDELFYKPREITEDGQWVGGGMGLSVRQHRLWNRHPGDQSREFVFVDGDSDGAARIFLPRGCINSGNWTGPHNPASLLSYNIADHLPPVNMISKLTSAKATRENGTVEYPIDLVLMKLSENAILISTADRGHAVIDRVRNEQGKWLYKYTPVTNLQPVADGTIRYDPVEDPQTDPLRLYEQFPNRLLEQYHDETEWLRATASTEYPDSVVTLTRHMLWDKNLQYREDEYAPDLVVTAKKNWYFGIKDSPGTMHGYPFPDAMHATLFVSGPGIRRGAKVEHPSRLVDLTPTILEMVNAPFDPDELDGTPIRSIYEPQSEANLATTEPVFWRDIDLEAWKPLVYRPMKRNEYLPISVNNPTSPRDLNNIAYNLVGAGDLNVLRLLDDVVSPLSRSRGSVLRPTSRADRTMRRSRKDWVAEGTRALNVSGATISDYSLTSLGNMKRVDGSLDWVQKRGLNLDYRLSSHLGRERLPGSRQIHQGIDGIQGGIWELYRYTQRVAVQLLDEKLLNGIENTTDRSINAFRKHPSEILVREAPAVEREPRLAAQPVE